MDVLDKYLSQLNEAGGGALKKLAQDSIKGGAKQSLWWTLAIQPAVFLAWRLLGRQFDEAVKKCGTLARGPGRNACICRERIKIYTRKIGILNRSLSQCNTAKDPETCKEGFRLEIDKLKNKISLEKAKLEGIVGAGNTEPAAANESENLNEILPAVIGLAGFMIGGMIVDKIMFLSWRSALASFSNASRKCGSFKEGPQRNLCMSRIKLASLLKRETILMRILNNCGSQKNPQKCKEKITKKLTDHRRHIQIERDNIFGYKKEMEEE